MIKIEKTTELVKVLLPIETLTFNRTHFDWICDNIYFFSTQSPHSTKIIREKGNIEDMNMGHWLCLQGQYQAKFNDGTIKSLDVEYLIRGYREYCNEELIRLGISIL